MALSKGFLFWYLWSFEVSYGSQAMIILIAYNTLEQFIYNNHLIIIRSSVKWIHKFLWSFTTSPCSLCLSYSSQSCTLTMNTMKNVFSTLYIGNRNVIFSWSDTGAQRGGEISLRSIFVTPHTHSFPPIQLDRSFCITIIPANRASEHPVLEWLVSYTAVQVHKSHCYFCYSVTALIYLQ